MTLSGAPVREATAAGASTRKPRLLDRMRLLRAAQDGEDLMPADSMGTVVHVYEGGEGLEVEFSTPRHAVLTLRPTEVQPI